MSTVSMFFLIFFLMAKEQLVTTAHNLATLLSQLLEKISSVLVTEKASTSAELHSKMLFDRSLQVAVQTHSCVCAGRLWTSRASCLRFQWVKRHSCRYYPPKTTALLHKQRPCCVWKDYRYTAPPWRRLGWAVIHCFMQHSIDASLSDHKGLPRSKTSFLEFLPILYLIDSRGADCLTTWLENLNIVGKFLQVSH